MLSRQPRQRRRYPHQHHGQGAGLLNEDILELVLRHANWNPYMLCAIACVCKALNELIKLEMWKKFCLSRAPRMAADLSFGVKNDAIEINWDKLGKLMIYCAGCHSTRHFKSLSPPGGGHLVLKSRFSRTSGRSFLHPKCRSDVLYVTDLCEHLDDEEDVGLFRGVFKSFGASKTRQMLLDRGKLEEGACCPFCRSRVWSMMEARMIPPSAQRRLASYDYENSIEYLVCINGHLTGMCLLLPLPDSDEERAGGGGGRGGGGGDDGGGDEDVDDDNEPAAMARDNGKAVAINSSSDDCETDVRL
ncbi:EID1-like F-box protein 2 [Selaginella moellendorffii]|nr:EID1-like F-box protein 2 [Selaginella moellendorffii]|eukprot:XP_002964560.2 EID1-like F-box protein 2 [Selaginella moellendorffii]